MRNSAQHAVTLILNQVRNENLGERLWEEMW